MSLRIALLGTGFWARNAHVPALQALPDVEIAGCAAGTIEEARAFAASQRIPAAYATLDELLDATEPQILSIVAPDDVHAAATTEAIGRGITVFCEKPLANDARTAFQLASLQRESRAVATVGFSFRFSPALKAMKQDLDRGILGDPWFLELYEHNPQFHPTRGRPMNWKGDPDHAAAGALFEYGSHAVDLARWLLGGIATVSTCFGRVRPDAQLDDIATLQFRFRDRATTGMLVASWVLSGGFPGIRVRLHGSEALGEAMLDEWLPERERYVRIGDDAAVRERIRLEPVSGGPSAYTRRHYEGLLDTLSGRPVIDLPDLRDGAETQAILEAALAATDRWRDVVRA